jgi:hypothetical protein
MVDIQFRGDVTGFPTVVELRDNQSPDKFTMSFDNDSHVMAVLEGNEIALCMPGPTVLQDSWRIPSTVLPLSALEKK